MKLCLLFYSVSLLSFVSVGQISDSERIKLVERDHGVSDEKVERIAQEALQMKEAVKKAVNERFLKLKLSSEYLSHPASAGTGRRGQAGFSLSWRRSQVKFDVSVTLLFNSEEAAKAFRFGTSRISMGEFYPAPDFLGKHSLLVKNVLYNKSMTNVGIHFAKGRLMVSTYLTNYKQTAAQNERDLIEFVRAIEPLLNAKLTFEEV